MRLVVLCVFLSVFVSAQPTITSFSPTSGPTGTSVTINGSGFSGSTTTDVVYFGSVKGVVTSATSNQLVVTVPNSASSSSYISVINTSSKLSYTHQNDAFVTTHADGIAATSAISNQFSSASIGTGPQMSFGTSYQHWRKMLSGDFDNDGSNDFVSLGPDASASILIFRNISSSGDMVTLSSFSSSTIALSQEFEGLNYYSQDLNNDGKLDIVMGAFGKLLFLINTTSSVGQISFNQVEISASGAHYRLRIADFNGDGLKDVITYNGGSSILVFETTAVTGNSISINTTPTTISMPSGYNALDLDVYDFNNDGLNDIVVQSENSSGLSVHRFLNNTSTPISFSTPLEISSGTSDGNYTNWGGITVYDYDSDGDGDIVFTSAGGAGQLVYMVRNDNNSTYSTFSIGNWSGSSNMPLNLKSLDMNGDGKVDVVIGGGSNSGGFRAILNQYTSGTMTASHFSSISGIYYNTLYSGVIDDFNQDGKPDVIHNRYYSSNLYFYTNSPGPFISVGPSSLTLTSCQGVGVSQSFTVSGDYLTNNIVITAPSNFEISTNNSSFSSSITLTQFSGTVNSTNIYVRLTSGATGTPTGNISLTSSGASSKTVSLTGTVYSNPTISGNTSLIAGQSSSLSATGTPAAASPWTSSNISVATVDDNGVVTALSAGSTTITYTTTDGCTDTETITVASYDMTNLTVTGGTMSPSFSTAVQDYTVSYSTLPGSMSFTPTVSSGSTLLVNGSAHTSGTAYTVSTFNPITTKFKLEVQYNGTTINTYYLYICKTQTDVPAPTGTWQDLFAGATFDPNNDQQATAHTDLVGNATDVMMQAQQNVINFADGADKIYYFRIRLGHTDEPKTSAYFGIDVTNDQKVNLVVEANLKDKNPYVAYHIIDPTKDGSGPSQTGWLNSTNNIDIERELNDRHSHIIAYPTTGQSTTDNDIDSPLGGQNNGIDTWLEFSFSESSFEDFTLDALGTAADGSQVYGLATFTSTSQTANGDIGGVNDNTADLTQSWAQLGNILSTSLNTATNEDVDDPFVDVLSTYSYNGDATIYGVWNADVHPGSSLVVTVDNNETFYYNVTGQSNTITVNGFSWSINVSGYALGTYDVDGIMTNTSGLVGTGTGDLIVGVQVDSLTTSDQTPTITGKVNSGFGGSFSLSVYKRSDNTLAAGPYGSPTISGTDWSVDVPATLSLDNYYAQVTVQENTSTSIARGDLNIIGNIPTIEISQASLSQNFSGSVSVSGTSNQAAGVTVNLTITYPDGSTESVTTITIALGDWSYDFANLSGTPTSGDYVIYASIAYPDASGAVASDQEVLTLKNIWTGATSSAWTTSSNWSANTVPTSTETAYVFNDSTGFTVPNEPVISSDITVGDILLESGRTLTVQGVNTDAVVNNRITVDGSVTVDARATLEVRGAIRNNGTVTVNDDGSIVQTSEENNNDGDGTGNFIISREAWVSGNQRYNYWGSPVKSTTMAEVFGAASNIPTNESDWYTWDESDGTYDGTNWNAVWDQVYTNTVMTPGRGYITTGSPTGYGGRYETRTFSDEDVNNGNVVVSLNSPVDGAFALVSNPYPSAIDMELFVDEQGGNISSTVYLWEHTTLQVDNSGIVNGPNNPLDYATFVRGNLNNPGQGLGVASSAVTSAGTTPGLKNGKVPTKNIGVAQGFLVELGTPAPSTITFTNDMRVNGNNTSFFKVNDVEKIWLGLWHENRSSNQILVARDEDATMYFDANMEGIKLKGNTDLSFYSILGNEDLAIQSIYKDPINLQLIPLGIDAWKAGVHTIGIDSLADVPAHVQIVLFDSLMGIHTDLRQGYYDFAVNWTGPIRDRFYLKLSESTVNIGDVSNDDEPVLWYTQGSDVVFTIPSPKVGAAFRIVNNLGQTVHTGSISDERLRINASAFETGMYHFVIDAGNQTTKFIIH